MSETHEKNHMKLPESFRDINARYPDVAKAFSALGDAIHNAGPLSERERRLVKLALAVGSRMEGPVHSAARKGLYAGLTPDDLRQVALLSLTTVGFPTMAATLSWVEDVVASAETGKRDPNAAP